MNIPPWLRSLPRVLDENPIHPWPSRSFRKKAGILVLLGVHPEGSISMILTERSPHLAIHAGQIAFPGGGCEGEETPFDAALRETFEEIHLPPQRVHILGPLGRTFSPFDIEVQPYVGYTSLPYPFKPNEEVSRIVTVPIHALLKSKPRVFLWQVYGVVVPLFTYRVHGDVIWGMTGRVVADLVRRIRWVLHKPPPRNFS